ncbi:hypothetical protein BDV26DRAFT_276192 [Aspergillus bertholletiae]|uniref:WSC domain-containing protein n=1 Tax=Aspergillus bertholletiae TaxID=1226010 RepID=A0A5N7ANH5_9EURO|nr:hypothetical protein BDV26DRAFT_276192 [Aspergillus bertholletiae]
MKLFATSAAYLAIPMALLVSAQSTNMNDVGCYSDITGFVNQGSFTYQSPGTCAKLCEGSDAEYIALQKGNNCWCGTSAPEKKSRVSDDKCNAKCAGWPESMCGSDDSWSVYQLSGSSKETETASTSTATSTSGSTSTSLHQSGSTTDASTSSASATSGANRTASATQSGSASQSASSAAATPTTSTSAATRRFKLPFFL